MRKSFITIIILALAAITLPASQLNATVILPDLPAGTQYQIIFVTDGGTSGLSSDIAFYNSFATTQANRNSTLAALTASGVQWLGVVSTAAVAANVNAPSSGLVFNTVGQEVASPTANLYSGGLLNSVAYDEDGNPNQGQFTQLCWTGSDHFGNKFTTPNETLGGPGGSVGRMGQNTVLGPQWLDGSGGPLGVGAYSIYALSSVITAVPEPSTLALLTLGGVIAFAAKRRRFS